MMCAIFLGTSKTCWHRQRPSDRKQFGEAAPLKNRKMLILLGRGLDLSVFLPRSLVACWCQQHRHRNPANQARGDVLT